MLETRIYRMSEGELPVPVTYRDRTTHVFAIPGDETIRVIVYRNEPEGPFGPFVDKVSETVRRSKPLLRDFQDRETLLPGVATPGRALSFRFRGDNKDTYEIRLLFSFRGTYFSLNVTSEDGDRDRCEAVVRSVVSSFRPKEITES
jgi:hypothetical protein